MDLISYVYVILNKIPHTWEYFVFSFPFIIGTSVFVQEEGFEKVFQTVSYSGDNMVYCQECEKKTEATSVSFKHQL